MTPAGMHYLKHTSSFKLENWVTYLTTDSKSSQVEWTNTFDLMNDMIRYHH